MNVDVRSRLDALAAALRTPADASSGGSNETSPDEVADMQRAVTASLDLLLQRVAAVTAVLRRQDAGWDALDQVAAQVVMGDLAVIARIARSMGQLAESRLAWASKELTDAGREAERILKAARAAE
jgi:hypothetical protein